MQLEPRLRGNVRERNGYDLASRQAAARQRADQDTQRTALINCQATPRTLADADLAPGGRRGNHAIDTAMAFTGGRGKYSQALAKT